MPLRSHSSLPKSPKTGSNWQNKTEVSEPPYSKRETSAEPTRVHDAAKVDYQYFTRRYRKIAQNKPSQKATPEKGGMSTISRDTKHDNPSASLAFPF